MPRFVPPLKLAVLGLAAWSVLLGSCSQTPITVTLHSLQASGNVSFVCRGDDQINYGHLATGHRLDACPDNDHVTRRLLGLVTQTSTNEVAVVDLVSQSVIDDDPSTPGFSFLRVGARPGAIVTTPGGAASFVGVSGLQKNGIFALPTTCLGPPTGTQKPRDLTTWAACALPSAPGDMAVVVDPAPSTLEARAQCPMVDAYTPVDQDARECPADLTGEAGGPLGRRKLLVALPDQHQVVLIDAQRLLDQEPGEFPVCKIERTFTLDPESPTTPVQPVLPSDLDVAGTNSCPVTSYPPAASAESTPGGFAVSDSKVYVADRTRPVVHVLDMSDPCAAKELPPLLPHSYLSPTRVVTTSRVAVSPLTPAGKQYVYAVDETDQPTSSVMVFDVSPNSTNRTPLVFPGAPRNPYNPPDRVQFRAPVRDVSFVMRDFPQSNADTGAGQFGLSCDPDPRSGDGPGTAYRPASDFSDGARPVNLRGLFGFAMLTNGQVAIIDVEDFDAPCRRPITSNTTQFEDFRGCVADKPVPGQSTVPTYFTEGTGTDPTALPTVTNESSCKVIEPHRPRSSQLAISSSLVGLHAPTLRSFPQFSNPDPSAVIAVTKQPHMLAADFADPNPSVSTTMPAQVDVSTQLYANCPGGFSSNNPPPCDLFSGALPLNLVPDTAGSLQNSLSLPLAEPRSYAQDEAPVLTFEGRVLGERKSGFLSLPPAGSSDPSVLRDPDANFCSEGVEDSAAIMSEAASLGIPTSKQKLWADAHADYVQITGDFPADDDVYWRIGQGQFCTDLLKGGDGSMPKGGDRDNCISEFGDIDDPAVLKETRDLSISSAFSDHLQVTPRHCGSPEDCAQKLAQMACCFPSGTAYTVRASHQWLVSGSAGLHDIAADASGQCVHTASCDPRKQFFRSRAFEVCDASSAFDPNVDTDGQCSLDNPNVGCVGTSFPVAPGGPASQCIFENLTSRFVVLRGGQPSTRGMTFSWQTTGGYTPLTLSLTPQSSAVNPQSMSYLPELGYLAVVDGATLGLSLFDLDSLGLVPLSPYF